MNGTTASFEPVWVSNGAIADTLLSNDYRRAWTDLIDWRLIEWRTRRDLFDRDEIDPPTLAALDQSMQFALELRDRNAVPPRWLIPTGDGGVVFEWGNPKGTVIRYEADAAGELWFQIVEKGAPAERRQVL